VRDSARIEDVDHTLRGNRSHEVVDAVGIDANNQSLVVAGVVEHPSGFPLSFTPAAFDAPGLWQLHERMAEHFMSQRPAVVAVMSNLSNQTSPSNLRARVQLETVATLAAHSVGVAVEEVKTGAAVKHLGVPKGSQVSDRQHLRDVLERALGAERLSPTPGRRCVAIAVALAAAGLDLGDVA
jgi:hypothetical protein